MDETADPEFSDRDYVNSLARGLEVICAFTRSRPRMTLSDVARSTGMSRATVRRLLLTLVKEDYAEKTGKYFSLKPKVLELGYSALASMDIVEVSQPIINELADKVQESVFAVMLAGDDVVYVARATSQRVINVSVSVGSRSPAYAVSSGRVLLAAQPQDMLLNYLDRLKLEKLTPNTVSSKVKLRQLIEEVRRSGYAVVDQELEIGLGSISVPILDGGDKVIAALNIGTPSVRTSLQDMETRLLPELRVASQRITAALESTRSSR